MEKNKKTITVILGPTSSGKTSLALELCKEVGGMIISADSRQIFKYLDIGTGKMPINFGGNVQKNDREWLIDGISIFGYDLVSPGEYFSAVDFGRFAWQVIEKEQKAHNPRKIFVIGGTGFYIDVLTGNIKISQKGPNLILRQELEKEDLTSLLSMLSSLNKVKYENIDQKNKVRVMRAVESELSQNEIADTPPPQHDALKTSLLLRQDFTFEYFGLTSERAHLYERADKWVDVIWENGLLQEVQNLRENFGQTPQMNGLIYKSVVAHLDGVMTDSDAIQRCKFDVHAYIRRQQTWFKKNNSILWFDILQNPADLILEKLL